MPERGNCWAKRGRNDIEEGERKMRHEWASKV